MLYSNIIPAIFLERPNRFVAHVCIAGKMELCHVKNTGRCRELLIPGTQVYVQKACSVNRKTPYDLIAVHRKEGNRLINIDSQVPNQVVAEWIADTNPFGPVRLLRREVTFGSSRFDLYVETGQQQIFVEVKGVTLERNGVALFPDAPTVRGMKHLEELGRSVKAGYSAAVVLLIQMREVDYFTPNVDTDPAFAQALSQAASNGVRLIALDCDITPESISARSHVPIHLTGQPPILP